MEVDKLTDTVIIHSHYLPTVIQEINTNLEAKPNPRIISFNKQTDKSSKGQCLKSNNTLLNKL